MKPTRAGIALGSNLGDRLRMLQKARDQIRMIPGVEPPVSLSAIYETAPVNCEPNARDFYNAVVQVNFRGSAEELLHALREIEIGLGRATEPASKGADLRNASRPIDLDLLYFGELTIDRPELQLPHPRMVDRAFVLQPLADLEPDLQLPGQPATVRELLKRLPFDKSVKRVIEQW